jgi:flagellar basal body-associated protein FliL
MNQIWRSMGIGNSAGNGNNGGMGGMMGGNGTGTTATTNLWVIPITIMVVAIIGVIGISFYLVLPEIRNKKSTCEPAKNDASSATSAKTSIIDASNLNVASTSCDVILKTMTAQEQKLLTVLIAH